MNKRILRGKCAAPFPGKLKIQQFSETGNSEEYCSSKLTVACLVGGATVCCHNTSLLENKPIEVKLEFFQEWDRCVCNWCFFARCSQGVPAKLKKRCSGARRIAFSLILPSVW
jgi:hypothetical protein